MENDAKLIPLCPDCGESIPDKGPMCLCIEAKLPGMELHRSETLARKLVYLEAVVGLLVIKLTERQSERSNKRGSRAAKRHQTPK